LLTNNKHTDTCFSSKPCFVARHTADNQNNITMSDFVTKQEHDDQTAVYFNIEAEEVMAIGEKMEAINEQAYMNGYNWEAFLNQYLQINHPALLDGLETDPEAGTYVALYDKADADKAGQLVGVIKELIGNPDKVYGFLKENGEEIEWD